MLSYINPSLFKELVLEFLLGYNCFERLFKLGFSLSSNIPSLYFLPRRVSFAFSCQLLTYTSYWSSQASIKPLLVHHLNCETCCCMQLYLGQRLIPWPWSASKVFIIIHVAQWGIVLSLHPHTNSRWYELKKLKTFILSILFLQERIFEIMINRCIMMLNVSLRW